MYRGAFYFYTYQMEKLETRETEANQYRKEIPTSLVWLLFVAEKEGIMKNEKCEIEWYLHFDFEPSVVARRTTKLSIKQQGTSQ